MNKAAHLLKVIQEGYIAVSFDTPGQQQLNQIIEQVLAAHPAEQMTPVSDLTDLHCTLMYSPSTPALEIHPDLEGQILELNNLQFDMFGPEEAPDTLVIKFLCRELDDYNKAYVEKGEVPSERSADYKPHITIAKDVVGIDMSKLPTLPDRLKIAVLKHWSEPVKED